MPLLSRLQCNALASLDHFFINIFPLVIVNQSNGWVLQQVGIARLVTCNNLALPLRALVDFTQAENGWHWRLLLLLGLVDYTYMYIQ